MDKYSSEVGEAPEIMILSVTLRLNVSTYN